MHIEPSKNKKTESLPKNKPKIKAADNTNAFKTNFISDVVSKLIDDYNKDLEQTLIELDELGSIFLEKKDWQSLKNYKSRVSRFFSEVTGRYLKLESDFGNAKMWKTKNYPLYTIQTVNKKLEELTNLVLKREIERIDLLSNLEIRGLIIDMKIR